MSELNLQLQAEELAHAVGQLYQAELLTPTGGNVSCRHEDSILITPSAKNKGQLLPEDMLLVDGKGRVLSGEGRPSIELSMHWAVYQACQHVRAIVHDHGAAGQLVGACELSLDALSLEACPFLDVPRLPFSPPGSHELAQQVADVLGEHAGLLLVNHGALTVGHDLQEAVNRSFMLDRTARLSLWSTLLGRSSRTIPDRLRKVLSM